MEIYRRIRILDTLILTLTISAVILSASAVVLTGFTLSGNMLFSAVAMPHGAAILYLLWRRGQLFDETL